MAGMEETGILKHSWQVCTAGNSLPVSQEVKQKLSYNPEPLLPSSLPRRNESRRTHKDLYVNVHKTFIHSRQK